MALSSQRLPPAFSINDLPDELIQHVFLFTPTGLPRQVCSFWRGQEEPILWQRRFREAFSRLYQERSNPAYIKLIGPLNWQHEYIYAYSQLCNVGNAGFADYVAMRDVDVSKLNELLASENALERLSHCDRQGNNIFNYLANYDPVERQIILNKISDLLIKEVTTDEGELDTRKKFKNVKTWRSLFSLDEHNASIPAILLIMVACYQPNLLEHYRLKEEYFGFRSRHRLLRMALDYNNEQAFFSIFDGNDSSDIQSALHHLDKNRQQKINISPSFAHRLFKTAVATINIEDPGEDSNLEEREDAVTEYRTILNFAVLLRQEEYLSKQLESPETKKLMYAVNCDGISTLHFVCHYDVSFYQFFCNKNISSAGLKQSCSDDIPESDLLVYAAACGNVMLLDCLIQENKARNQPVSDEVMNAAVKNGHLDCIRLLVRHSKMLTPENIVAALRLKHLHILEYVGHQPHFVMLLKNYYFSSAIFSQNDSRLIKFMLRHIDVKQKSHTTGETVLHILARSYEKQNDTIRLLLSHGLDINEIDATGRTPLHYTMLALGSTHNDNFEKANACLSNLTALLTAGADMETIRDVDGNTAFDYLLKAIAYCKTHSFLPDDFTIPNSRPTKTLG